MYIYHKKVKNRYGKTYTYAYLCESYRNSKGKVTHKVIKYLGRNYDKEEVARLIREYEAKEAGKDFNEFLLNQDIMKSSADKLYLSLMTHLLKKEGYEEDKGTFKKGKVRINPQTYSVEKNNRAGEVRIGGDNINSLFLKQLHKKVRAIKGMMEIKRLEEFEY